MILKTELIQETCSKILSAVDGNELSVITETLELIAENNLLKLNVTNREYYAQVSLPIDSFETFHATVNANKFLKLISQMTTNEVEFNVIENSLVVKGNGTYKFPLIFDNDKLLELPEIKILNRTNEFDIHSDILNSILQFNSKQLTRGTISKPVQKLYYVDEQGAITFTSGACVNSFSLPNPVRLLLNNRLVKLFKLFKDEQVHFSLGFDAISDEIIQTKVSFETSDIKLTAILSCDDTLLNSVPATAIRDRALKEYPYSVTVSKDLLLQTINRLALFDCDENNRQIIKPYSAFEFTADKMTIYDFNKQNHEDVCFANNCVELGNGYTATLDLYDLKTVLESCSEQYLTLSFGDSRAFVVSRAKVYNVIPEVRV